MAALGVLSIGAEASLAASGWVPPQDIAPVAGRSEPIPQVVLDLKGNAIAIWRRGGAGVGDVAIQSAARPAGGPWQAPVDISRPTPAEDVSASVVPQIAVDAGGSVVAVWQRFDGTGLVVQAAEHPAGGSWRAPIDISDVMSLPNAPAPRIAFDRQGNAQAIWSVQDVFGSTIASAERPAGGTWGLPVVVARQTGFSMFGVRLAIDAQGTAYAVWQRTQGSTPAPSQLAVRRAGETWQSPEDIPGTTVTTGLDLAVDPAGDIVVAWDAFLSAHAVVRPAGAGWEAPVTLGTNGAGPVVAMDAAGNATVVFLDGTGALEAMGHPNAGQWQPAVPISEAGREINQLSTLVLDPQGEPVVAWTDATGPRSSVMTARRVGGAWHAPVRLTADERTAAAPDLAVDPQGNGVAVWRDNTTRVISAAGFDATAPEFRGLTVPASGAAGRAMSFSATPFDVWSAPLATRWSFGDGATATGNAVSHTYNAVGRQSVGVTTTDLVGNSAGGTKAILIRPSVLGLRVSPNAFRRKRPGTLSFRLAAASTVRFTVDRVRIGRRVGKRCVTATRSNRRRATCTRYVRAGSFSRRRPSGSSRLRMPVRVSGHRLATSRYRLSATPRAVGLTGMASRTGFRITG